MSSEFLYIAQLLNLSSPEITKPQRVMHLWGNASAVHTKWRANLALRCSGGGKFDRCGCLLRCSRWYDVSGEREALPPGSSHREWSAGAHPASLTQVSQRSSPTGVILAIALRGYV